MQEMRKIKTSRTMSERRDNEGLVRKAFLDTLYDESFEDPYKYESFEEAMQDLSGKFKLSMAEISYLRKKSADGKVSFHKIVKRQE
jgi:protein-tyrosine-phosphatase